MKQTLTNILALSLATVGFAHIVEQDPVSKLGKDVRLVFEVSLEGASTPSVLYGKTQNSQDEPRFKDYLTPLGQRQQYLVGSEYRLRYVDEAQYLNYSYDINDIWIQSTWNAKQIVSAQAQLHGLYPPYTNINTLTEWQQKNAVPPLDNVLNDQWT